MLSRVCLNFINKSNKINRNASLPLNSHSIISYSSNKFINNNQFNQLIINSNNNSKSSLFGLKKQFYCTSNNNNNKNESTIAKSLKIRNGILLFDFLDKDRGRNAFSNFSLYMFGMFLMSMGLYGCWLFFQDAPSKDNDLLYYMTLFGFFRSYHLFDKAGIIERYVDKYKEGKCNNVDFNMLRIMILDMPQYGSDSGLEDYLEKYGFYQAVYDNILNKEKKLQIDYDDLLLSLISTKGRPIPSEVIEKSSSPEVIKSFASAEPLMTHLTTVSFLDIAIVSLSAAFMAKNRFRYTVNGKYLLRSMLRSAGITAALLAAPKIKDTIHFIDEKYITNMQTHIALVTSALGFYGYQMVRFSTLPFITVFAPIFGIYPLVKFATFYFYRGNKSKETKLNSTESLE